MNTHTTDLDAVLVYPKTGLDLGSTVAPPFALLTIAAPLFHGGRKVEIIDQRVDPDWAARLRAALARNPCCCGISAMTGTQIRFGIEAARIIREVTGGKVPIVWGGCHPSILPDQTLRSDWADIVCVGEGDETFPELLESLRTKQPLSGVKGIGFLDGRKYIYTGDRPLMDVERLFPTPWELVNVEAYIHSDLYLKGCWRVLDLGQTSRGCPHRCGFCSSSAIQKHRWRAMPVDKALGFIQEDVRRFRLDGIWLRDDEFYVDPRRATAICQGMIEAQLGVSWYTSGTRVSDLLRGAMNR